MRQVRLLTRKPDNGQTIAPEVKLTFIRDMIEVSIPLFVNKNPSNPLPDDGGGGGDTTT